MIPDFACLRCGHAWAAGRRCQNCRCAIRPRHCPACLSKEWWLELGREVSIDENDLAYLRRVQLLAWRRGRKRLASGGENGYTRAIVNAPWKPPRERKPLGRSIRLVKRKARGVV